ncbi:unnamed protein product, partial [Laminaria digitata]
GFNFDVGDLEDFARATTDTRYGEFVEGERQHVSNDWATKSIVGVGEERQFFAELTMTNLLPLTRSLAGITASLCPSGEHTNVVSPTRKSQEVLEFVLVSTICAKAD